LSDIPVIVLTARDPLSNEQQALQAGAAAFFQKPADNNELLDVIRATLPPRGGSAPDADCSARYAGSGSSD
jgi:DNA-binding response OmpR family regulator